MKDTMNCQHALSNDVVYKEVVVIGNGPSGMVTSFMLAGNVPYLKEVPEDIPIDEMLRARLSNLPKGQSLYDLDLTELAEGLEGRSQNPIPLLMDNLLRPCADIGIEADSLIEWKYDAEKEVDHVVLGRGPAGGSWHTFPASVRTLSPAAWLTLPPLGPAPSPTSPHSARLPASAVAAYCRRYVKACGLTRYFRSGVVVTGVRRAGRLASPCGQRCPHAASFWVSGYDMCAGRAFRYACRRVVLACGAGERPNTLAARLAPACLHRLAAVERALALTHAVSDSGSGPPAVLVVGSGVSAADAVLAARGAHARVLHAHRRPPPALARLPPHQYPDYCQVYKMMCDGSSGKYPYYTSYPEHTIVDIQPENDAPYSDHEDYRAIRPKRVKLLNLVTNQETEVTVSIVAVLIGSKPDLFFLQTNFNLSNIQLDADCIKCTEETKIKKKIEDERRQCFLRNQWLYIKSVLGQSIQSCKSRYLNYSEINGNSDTKCNSECKKTRDCSCDVIKTEVKSEIIPNKVKCQCQPTNPYSNGLGFGIDPKKPVDGRSNPIAIDKSTHELLNAPKGLYALGPITADNFIRFIPGGALAIAAHFHKERKLTE